MLFDEDGDGDGEGEGEGPAEPPVAEPPEIAQQEEEAVMQLVAACAEAVAAVVGGLQDLPGVEQLERNTWQVSDRFPAGSLASHARIPLPAS